MLVEKIPPRLRATLVLLTIIAVVICKWPFWLFLVWLFVLLPTSAYAGVGRAHMTFCASFLLPIGIGLLVIWGAIVGAPPGAMPRSNPTAGTLYALTLLGRLTVFSCVVQILYLGLSPQRLITELRGLGVQREFLLVTLGALAILPEVRMRAVQVYDAGRARGLLHRKSLPRRLRLVPYVLRGLFSWTIRSAIERARLWEERAIVGPVPRSACCPTATTVGPSVTVVEGANFSGRTAFLRTLSRTNGSIYLGPEIYNYLSGLSLTVQDEMELSPASHEVSTSIIDSLAIRHLLSRNPLTLSGGEQTSVVVAAALASCPTTLSVDCSLEQLDASRKSRIIQALGHHSSLVGASLIADNRLEELPEMNALKKVTPNASVIENAFDVRPVTPVHKIDRHFHGCTVQVAALNFCYQREIPVLKDCSFTLEPGVYLLTGKNGAGKSTLSRILAGLLKPLNPCIVVNGAPRALWQEEGSIFCYHYQNPDAQLFATSVGEELALAPNEFRLSNSTELVSDMAECFGLSGILHEHPLDLPFVLRKRVALAACFTSGRPWIILDEPTLGQDNSTCRSLAETIKKLVQKQVGFLIISHSGFFVDLLPSRMLHLRDGTIEAG